MIDNDGMISFEVSFRHYLDEPDDNLSFIKDKVDFLAKDLRDLDNEMHRFYFKTIELDSNLRRDDKNYDDKKYIGISFEVPGRKLDAIMLRLSDRLSFEPLKTHISITLPKVKIRIETDDPEDISHVSRVFSQSFLFEPVCQYVIEANKYANYTEGLTNTARRNLDYSREEINLSSTVNFSKAEAEYLLDKAAGPFKSEENREQHFKRITNQEVESLEELIKSDWYRVKFDDNNAIDRAFDDGWILVRELAENLFLNVETAENYYRDRVRISRSRIDIYREQKQRFESYKEELSKKRIEAERQKKRNAKTKEVSEKYKRCFRKAIFNGLYPSLEDQAKLLQIRRLMSQTNEHIIGKTNEEILEIEESIRSELYGSINSDRGVDYSRLRALLYNKQWKDADQETEYLLLSKFRNDMMPFNEKSIRNICRTDINTIDQLWSRYSKGRFGFRAQLSVFNAGEDAEIGSIRRAANFQYRVGWRYAVSWFSKGIKSYDNFNFTLGAPKGHLPTWRWCCTQLGSGYFLRDSLVFTILSYIEACLDLSTLGESSGMSTEDAAV